MTKLIHMYTIHKHFVCYRISMWRILQNYILNLFFPIACLSCGKIGEALCNSCLSTIPIEHYRRGTSVATFSYQSPLIRTAIRSLKYKHNRHIATIFATVLYDIILEDISDQKSITNEYAPVLIPIPLHNKRKRQRGYNQSELLCNELSLINPLSFILKKDVLYRDRDTPSQTTLKNKKARAENVRGCFKVKNPETIKGASIILIDDIITTGATLNEAMKTLRKAGAQKVVAYTVAHS